MVIECTNCEKQYKIREDQLPEGRIGTLICKNCGVKIRLDLRKGRLINESPAASKMNLIVA